MVVMVEVDREAVKEMRPNIFYPKLINGDIVPNLSFASLFLLQWFGLAPVTSDTRAVTCSPAACAQLKVEDNGTVMYGDDRCSCC